ncbi:hypothetical protein ACNKHU_10095 [Shigella flexneri]
MKVSPPPVSWNTVPVVRWLIGMEVTAIEGKKVVLCKAPERDGPKQRCEPACVSIALPALAEKDKQDLIFVLRTRRRGSVAASFIRRRF